MPLPKIPKPAPTNKIGIKIKRPPFEVRKPNKLCFSGLEKSAEAAAIQGKNKDEIPKNTSNAAYT